MNKTTEAVKLAEALENDAKEHREVLGLPKAQPVKQEPVMDYEYICALREGEQHQAEDSYFFVRPENDTPTSRKMFCQGFERGFHKGLKYAAPVSAKREWVELEPVTYTNKEQVNELIKESARLIGSIKDEGDQYLTAIDALRNAYRIGLKDSPVDAKAVRAEALEEAAKWCEAKQSYNAMHANTEFAAGIREMK